jgi:tetraacyldisaccharide 4'-kinase
VKSLLRHIPDLWFRANLAPVLLPLLPLSWLFRCAVAARRFLYRSGALPTVTPSVPVIVIGNLTVGGSGKTPLTLMLVEALKKAGKSPGIVSRGYRGAEAGGGSEFEIFEVFPDSPVGRVGDEALLLARRAGVPVAVGRDRVRAARLLLKKHPECDLIVSDDGMQHYRLGRCAEIAIFDARGAGNGRLLPAGPLREPLSRLDNVAALVWNSRPASAECAPSQLSPPSVPAYAMCLEGERFYLLDTANLAERKTRSADEFRGMSLHAVAGTGNPSRFFGHLESLGLVFESHPFPDHHVYTTDDFAFARNGGVVLMTEKDAVKCSGIAPDQTWVLPVDARVEPIGGAPGLIDLLLEKIHGSTAA